MKMCSLVPKDKLNGYERYEPDSGPAKDQWQYELDANEVESRYVQGPTVR